MKQSVIVAVGGLLITAGVVSAQAGGACDADGHAGHDHASHAAKAATLKMQTTCPVMGGKINKKLYTDHKGKRIYVCCAGCIPAIKKNPDLYIKKLETSGVTLEAVSKGNAAAPTCAAGCEHDDKKQGVEAEAHDDHDGDDDGKDDDHDGHDH